MPRAAADIVLTQEGLSVIIDAIYISRKIFKRMKNYVTTASREFLFVVVGCYFAIILLFCQRAHS